MCKVGCLNIGVLLELEPIRQNSGKGPARLRQRTGKTPAKDRQDSGKRPARLRQRTGKAPARTFCYICCFHMAHRTAYFIVVGIG